MNQVDIFSHARFFLITSHRNRIVKMNFFDDNFEETSEFEFLEGVNLSTMPANPTGEVLVIAIVVNVFDVVIVIVDEIVVVVVIIYFVVVVVVVVVVAVVVVIVIVFVVVNCGVG